MSGGKSVTCWRSVVYSSFIRRWNWPPTYEFILKWGPLAQSVELRTWDREVPGSGVRVGGGFHMYSWSRCSAYVALKLKTEYHAYTNKNVCTWKSERKKIIIWKWRWTPNNPIIIFSLERVILSRKMFLFHVMQWKCLLYVCYYVLHLRKPYIRIKHGNSLL